MLAVQIRHYACLLLICTASGPSTATGGTPIRSIWRGMVSGRRLEGSQAVLLAVMQGAVAVHGRAVSFDELGGGSSMRRLDVQVPAPDGRSNGTLHLPDGDGPWPGVLVFPDAGGARETFRQMGDRLAAMDYAALIPDIYYRAGE